MNTRKICTKSFHGRSQDFGTGGSDHVTWWKWRHVAMVTSQESQLVRPHIRRSIHVCRKQETTIHDSEVLLHHRQDSLYVLYSSTTPSLVSAVFCWKKVGNFAFRPVGGSAVDCLPCRFDIAYAILALILHLIHWRQDIWLEYIVRNTGESCIINVFSACYTYTGRTIN